MKKITHLLLLVTGITLVACDSPKNTVAQTRKELSAFQAKPDNSTQSAVEASLQKLDQQITTLEAKGETAEADLYRRQAMALRTDFQAARMARAVNDASSAIRGFGEAIKDAGKSFSETLDAADKGTNAP